MNFPTRPQIKPDQKSSASVSRNPLPTPNKISKPAVVPQGLIKREIQTVVGPMEWVVKPIQITTATNPVKPSNVNNNNNNNNNATKVQQAPPKNTTANTNTTTKKPTTTATTTTIVGGAKEKGESNIFFYDRDRIPIPCLVLFHQKNELPKRFQLQPSDKNQLIVNANG